MTVGYTTTPLNSLLVITLVIECLIIPQRTYILGDMKDNIAAIYHHINNTHLVNGTIKNNRPACQINIAHVICNLITQLYVLRKTIMAISTKDSKSNSTDFIEMEVVS